MKRILTSLFILLQSSFVVADGFYAPLQNNLNFQGSGSATFARTSEITYQNSTGDWTTERVNETPVYGANGIVINPAGTNEIDGVYSVPGADQDGSEQASGNLTIGKRYRITAQNGEDFTADGAGDNNVGTEFTATGTNVTLDSNDKAVEIGGTDDSDDSFVSGLGTGVTHTAANAPIPGMTYVSANNGSVSIVTDQSKLESAQLDGLTGGYKVYYVDCTGEATTCTFDLTGSAGDNNAYIMSAFVRGSGNITLRGDITNSAEGTQAMSSEYQRMIGTIAAANVTDNFRAAFSPGSEAWLLMPVMEESAVPTLPIQVYGATATRDATDLSWPTSGNLPVNNITIYMEYTPLVDTNATISLLGSYVDASNYFWFAHSGTDYVFRKHNAGSSEESTYTAGLTAAVTTKMCARFSSSAGVDSWIDGTQGSNDNNTDNIAGLDTSFFIGQNELNSQYAYGEIGNVAIIPRALPDAHCVELTDGTVSVRHFFQRSRILFDILGL